MELNKIEVTTSRWHASSSNDTTSFLLPCVVLPRCAIGRIADTLSDGWHSGFAHRLQHQGSSQSRQLRRVATEIHSCRCRRGLTRRRARGSDAEPAGADGGEGGELPGLGCCRRFQLNSNGDAMRLSEYPSIKGAQGQGQQGEGRQAGTVPAIHHDNIP